MFTAKDCDLIFWSENLFKRWLLFVLKTHLTKDYINNKVFSMIFSTEHYVHTQQTFTCS